MELLNIIYHLNVYEPISAVSHFFGGIFFIIFSIYIFKKLKGDTGKIISIGIFSFTTICTLLISGIYHIYGPDDSFKLLLQKLDHTLIFLLIIGTITPIHQILFKGFMRWSFIIITWVITFTAIIIKLLYFEQFPEWLGTLIFLILGWGGAVTAFILWYRNSFRFIQSFILGGIVYTIGAILEFHRLPILIEGVFEAHELFHFLVIIGLIFHWHFILCIAKFSETYSYNPIEKNKKPIAA